jgi:hypothetical protein
MSQAGDIRLAAVQWLRDIPWQAFAGLSFVSPHIGLEPAVKRFMQFYHDLSHAMRTTIGYVYAVERHTKSGDRAVPRHIHSLLVAEAPIPHDIVSELWHPGGGVYDNLSSVTGYSDSGSIDYLFKHYTDHDAQIDFNADKLSRFSPSMPQHTMRTREARRWTEQRANPIDAATARARADHIIATEAKQRERATTRPFRPAPSVLGMPKVGIVVVPPYR